MDKKVLYKYIYIYKEKFIKFINVSYEKCVCKILIVIFCKSWNYVILIFIILHENNARFL